MATESKRRITEQEELFVDSAFGEYREHGSTEKNAFGVVASFDLKTLDLATPLNAQIVISR